MNGYFAALLRSSGIERRREGAARASIPGLELPALVEAVAHDPQPAPPGQQRSAADLRTAAVPSSVPPAPSPESAAPLSNSESSHAAASAAADATRPAVVAPIEPLGTATGARVEPAAQTEPSAHGEPGVPALEASAVPQPGALVRAVRRWIMANPALAPAETRAAAASASAVPVVHAAAPLPLPAPVPPRQSAVLADAMRLPAALAPAVQRPDPPAPLAAASFATLARDEAPLIPLPRTMRALTAPQDDAAAVSIGAIHLIVDASPAVRMQTPAPAPAVAAARAPMTSRSSLDRRSLRRI